MSHTDHAPDRQSAAAPAENHAHTPSFTASADDSQTSPRRSWAVLAVALAAQILVVLDISVVNTALPSIGASLGLAGGEMQALVTAYLVMSGGALLLGGRIADLLDRRRVFLTGLAVFTLASLFSGFADTGTQLTATRALQGLSAAILTPAALSIIMTTYSGDQRKKGLVLWGAVGSLGVAAGVLVGGALTTWIGWQSIFWINVPVGVVAFVVARSAVPPATTARAGFAQFDIPGAVTVLGGLMALMLALGGTETYGWVSARTLVTLAISAALLTAFAAVERRAEQPLIPVHTWKIRTLVSGTTVMLGISGILVGAVFLTSIFVQTVLGFSPLATGCRVPAFRLRHHSRHPGRPPPDRARLAPPHRRHRTAARRCRGRRPLAGHGLRELRHQRPAGSSRARSGSGHGLRARVGDVDGRDPGAALGYGVGVPHDRARGRCRTGCRSSLGSGGHGRQPRKPRERRSRLLPRLRRCSRDRRS